MRWVVVGTAAIVLGLAVLLAGCGGSDRSPEAYCTAFYDTAAPIRETYVEADEHMEEEPLQSIVTLLGSPGDLQVIFSSMVAHAPDAIRPDTEALSEAMKKEQEAMGEEFSNPIAAIGQGLAAGLTSSGSFVRVESYLNDHCPVNSSLAQSIIDGNE